MSRMNRSLILPAIICLLASLELGAQVPGILSYQGSVAVEGQSFDGGGLFKFALVNGDGTSTYWSNDGTSVNGAEPAASVAINVTKGLFSVKLGDAELPNMSSIPAAVFNQSDVRLRIWFNDGVRGWELLAPDQRIVSVGFAMTAANVPDGSITASKLSIGAVTSEKIASGAVLANLADSGMQAVPEGGLIVSADEALLDNPDYIQIGVVTQPDETPSSRYGNSAVWTGKEMIIFGGTSWGLTLSDGGLYNPETKLWKALSKANAPGATAGHCALWTGAEMIIWGGGDENSINNYSTNGAIYNPQTDSWRVMSHIGAPLGGFAENRAVWTGGELIVWGGNENDHSNIGARYNPMFDSWLPMSVIGAPSARAGHFMVWTGEDVVVLGGAQGSAKYNPVSDTWTTLTSVGLPFWVEQRYFSHDTVDYGVIWTGELIVVWDFPGSALYKYNPKSDEWHQASMHPLIEDIQNRYI